MACSCFWIFDALNEWILVLFSILPFLPPALSHWALPGGEGAWQDYTFDQIISQTFTPTSVGEEFGPTWSTHWFKVFSQGKYTNEYTKEVYQWNMREILERSAIRGKLSHCCSIFKNEHTLSNNLVGYIVYLRIDFFFFIRLFFTLISKIHSVFGGRT